MRIGVHRKANPMNRDLTGILYTRASFWEGLGRIIDFTGALNQYNASSSDVEADLAATAADWLAVGDDIRRSMIAYSKQMEQGGGDVTRSPIL